MSTIEVKQRISEMTPEERDDVMAFIQLLSQNDDFEASSELIKELDRRMAHHEANPELAKPWQEVIGKINKL